MRTIIYIALLLAFWWVGASPRHGRRGRDERQPDEEGWVPIPSDQESWTEPSLRSRRRLPRSSVCGLRTNACVDGRTFDLYHEAKTT